ncbi:MAG: hypothetical protein JNL32_10555 [Candidatus Kapabacteria bacterium]|nr:hypothetical protein [Candidatus Kapabacteria bacterium]
MKFIKWLHSQILPRNYIIIGIITLNCFVIGTTTCIASESNAVQNDSVRQDSIHKFLVYGEIWGPLFSIPGSINIEYPITKLSDDFNIYLRFGVGANPIVRIVNSGLFTGLVWGKEYGVELSGGFTWNWYYNVPDVYSGYRPGIKPALMFGYRYTNPDKHNSNVFRIGIGILYDYDDRYYDFTIKESRHVFTFYISKGFNL